MGNKLYTLPGLAYGYNALAPVMSVEQLTIHHQKHHQAYVNGANAVLERLDQARRGQTELDIRAVSKEFAFQISGHILHSIFWENLLPAGQGGGSEPDGELAGLIKEQFGSFTRFKKEFSQGALTVEGSGWMSLFYCHHTGRLILMQIEKHNINIIPEHLLLLVLDVFEHAYYIDYKNDRAKYIDAIWNVINWRKINNNLKTI